MATDRRPRARQRLSDAAADLDIPNALITAGRGRSWRSIRRKAPEPYRIQRPGNPLLPSRGGMPGPEQIQRKRIHRPHVIAVCADAIGSVPEFSPSRKAGPAKALQRSSSQQYVSLPFYPFIRQQVKPAAVTRCRCPGPLRRLSDGWRSGRRRGLLALGHMFFVIMSVHAKTDAARESIRHSLRLDRLSCYREWPEYSHPQNFQLMEKPSPRGPNIYVCTMGISLRP